MLTAITPVILTYNEAPNIERTLSQLYWAERIVVVDSYSTDGTLDILRQFPNVSVYQRAFDTHAMQWNYAVSLAETTWVLSLDADYCLSDALLKELASLQPDGSVDSYFIPFQYCVFGQPLRGTILPPREALFRRDTATYIDDGHTQRLQCWGNSSWLSASILHDDRKSLNRWLWAQDRYALLEVEKQMRSPWEEMGLGDRLRRIPGLAALIIFFYCLILKGGIWDGWAGWYYALQRATAELVLSLRWIEANQNALIPIQYEAAPNFPGQP